MRSFALLFASAVLFAAPPALADVVDLPPTNCPDGSEGATCHGGPHCAPRDCMTDADCKGGATCADRSFCMQEINCVGGWLNPDAALPPLTPIVVEPCDAAGACATGTCKSIKVCVDGAQAGSGSGGNGAGGAGAGDGAGGGEDGGDLVVKSCSCTAVGDHAAPWLGLAMVAVGTGIAAARRRRSR
ncbi:hypothetical protein [Polyangium mundeleinium]|uniref:Uncharacterized protein n=1 Tax=Polyangium mundeleinium TaxID=2995306 RepID=A0ABT5EKY6_9BACT|nr:hypothetical protein [Polyangium mundeleinium]MDC0741386.1 hypothetical protein [Polyangium mundeleinium]